MKISRCIMAAAIGVGMISAQDALADTQTTQVSVTMQESVSLTLNNDMSFGTVEYSASANGSIQLATDGSVSTTGSGYTASGSPQAASIAISATAGQDVAISCETSATMEESGGAQLTVENTEVSTGSTTSFGNGTECAGLGSSPEIYTMGSDDDNVYVGGEIDGTTPPSTAGSYSTSTGAGDSLQVQVVYN